MWIWFQNLIKRKQNIRKNARPKLEAIINSLAIWIWCQRVIERWWRKYFQMNNSDLKIHWEILFGKEIFVVFLIKISKFEFLVVPVLIFQFRFHILKERLMHFCFPRTIFFVFQIYVHAFINRKQTKWMKI